MDTREIGINPTHSFLIEDAVNLSSIEKAILLKEIRGMSIYKIRSGKDGWVYYSGKALCEKFPYMGQRSIERWLTEMIKDEVLDVKVENKMKYDKTKSYRPRQFRESVRQNGESMTQNGEPIPPLSPSLKKVGETEVSHPLPSSKEMLVTERLVLVDEFGGERASPISAKHKVSKELPTEGQLQLIEWSVKRRGFPFVDSASKQFKAFSLAKKAGITSSDKLRNRWMEFENDPFYKDKGFDWMTVVMSFNKKG